MEEDEKGEIDSRGETKIVEFSFTEKWDSMREAVERMDDFLSFQMEKNWKEQHVSLETMGHRLSSNKDEAD